MTGLSKNADEFQRNRDLAQLFGRAGQELTGTIMMGGEAFALFIEKQKELGNIISGVLIKKTEAFNDRLSRISFSLRVVRDSITTALLPVLDNLAEQFETALSEKNAKKIGQDFALGLVQGLITVVEALQTFHEAAHGIGKTFHQITAPIESFLNNVSIAFNLASLAFLSTPAAANAAMEAIEKLGKKNDEIRESYKQDFIPSESLTNSLESLKKLEKGMMSAFTPDPDNKDTEKKFTKFQIMLQQFAANAQAPLDTFKKTFKSTGAMIGDTIVSAMKKFEDTLVDGLMSGKFAFKDFANFVVKELLRIAVQKLIIEKITSGFTSFLSNLGFRQKGGTVTANRPYIVGEAGAELFVPNKTGTIVPNNRLGGGMASGGMPVNITYNIQAFDSRDTITAITENAPTISAIIESEFNKRGKRGFVT